MLHTHDTRGQRIDEVRFHPAWHELMSLSVRFGLHNLPWREARGGAHVARAALFYLASQNEAGHGCPISMTYACVPALRRQPDVAESWEPRIVTTTYDPRFLPAEQKSGVLIGMAMTEKQGGSDVRANTSRAVPAGKGGPGAEYRLTGHKWFCSAPMCDAFLVLAQAPDGLSCFLLPRWTPDGQRNNFFMQRLKNKLGNRSNASSEMEFADAYALLMGEEGRGVRTIVEMVNHTRLDCTLGSSGLMRQAVVQAVHHTRHRAAFGHLLIDQPLMQNVLADLCLESEAATVLAMRLARAYDSQEESEARFRRIATAVAKYWVCKRTPPAVNEALECLGGNGFVEDGILPRLYRESPLNSIWEGSGNVIASTSCGPCARAGDARGPACRNRPRPRSRPTLGRLRRRNPHAVEAAGGRSPPGPPARRASGAGAASLAAGAVFAAVRGRCVLRRPVGRRRRARLRHAAAGCRHRANHRPRRDPIAQPLLPYRPSRSEFARNLLTTAATPLLCYT